MNSLGTHDVVYSWGVLHHTGQMWNAIDQASQRVAPGGQFFIAIYNDEGGMSRFWKAVKRIYCSGTIGRWLMLAVFMPYFIARHLFKLIVTGGKGATSRTRGMSVYYDWIDWLGGYPFEVAKVEEAVALLPGPRVHSGKPDDDESVGCNELVFRAKPRRSIIDTKHSR